MWLSIHTPGREGEIVWWESRAPKVERPPIVGIEARRPLQRTDQIVICDRGLRIFRYREGQLIATGPPVPPRGADADLDVIRGVLRHYGASPSDAGPPPLPQEAIDDVHSIRDVADVLREHWTGVRVNPPVELDYRKIENELERSRHGMSQSRAAAQAL